jgi:hypothetical protein
VERALLRDGKLVFGGQDVGMTAIDGALRPEGSSSYTSGFFNAQLAGVHTADYAIIFHDIHLYF